MITLAINRGIAKLSELCIDGTRVLASASKRKTWTVERLAKALEQLDAQIVQAMQALEVNDSSDEDLLGEDASADRLPKAISDFKKRREQLSEHMETARQMDENRRRLGTKGPAQIPQTDPDSRILPGMPAGRVSDRRVLQSFNRRPKQTLWKVASPLRHERSHAGTILRRLIIAGD